MEKEYELIEEELKEETPVYVLEDSIPDILSLNDLNKAIEKKNEEKDAKEAEVSSVEEDRKALDEKIGGILNEEHVQEIAFNLKGLRELDEELEKKKAELEDIYGELRKLEDDGKALDASTRRMVEKMTSDYNSKVELYISLVDKYRSSANFNDFKESEDIVDELKKYKKYESFEAILKSVEEKEEVKPEEKVEEKVQEEAEVKEEIKTEVAPKEEKKEEALVELNEVKVDELKSEEPVKEEPVVTELPETEEVKIPSFDELLNNVEPVEDAPIAEVKPLLTSRIDKIADSNKKGITSTITVFKPKNTPVEDKTLSLAA